MEEIKVGEYVRIKSGVIGKVNYIEISGQGTRYYNERLEDTIYCIETNENEEWYRYKPQAITKHSFNIIDLIEVGDYVNGYKVVEVMENLETGELNLEMESSCPTANELCQIFNDEIKTIVTKEMMKSVEYEV